MDVIHSVLMLMLAGDVMLGRGIDQILRRSVDPVIYESYMHSARGYVELAEEKNGTDSEECASGVCLGRRAAPPQTSESTRSHHQSRDGRHFIG